MINKLQDIIKQYDNLMVKMSAPNIMSNIGQYKKLAREEKALSVVIPKAKTYIQKHNQLKEDEEIFKGDDKELKELVKDEIIELKQELEILES